MKNLRLRTKVIIIVLIAIIPMFLLHSISIASNRNKAIERELSSSKEYAEVLATTFENYLNRVWHAESIIGYTLLHCNDSIINDTQSFLKECELEEFSVSSYSWVNPAGQVVQSSTPGYIGLNVTGEDYYQRILSGEEKVVSDMYIDSVSCKATIAIAKAIGYEGIFKGIVLAHVDTENLNEIMPAKRAGETSALGLIDRNGVFVYRNGASAVCNELISIKPDSPAWKALDGQVIQTSNYLSSFDNRLRIGTTVPVCPIGWVTFATVATDEVLGWVDHDFWQSIIAMLSVIMITFACIVYFSLDLLNPIGILQKAAQGIAARDYTTRTNMDRKDEFGQIGLSFDKMAEHIQTLENSRILFLQSAAHELRNPMTSVKGITSLIYKQVKEGKPVDSAIPLVEMLNKEVTRLARLLNQLLEGFRTEQENFNIRDGMKIIDMAEVVNDVVVVFEMDTTNNRVIINQCSQCHYPVLGDRARLEDVMRNLISNAVKYSSDSTEITINCERKEGYVIVSVKDQGRGIPSKELTRIFNSFHRIGTFDDQDPGGMGLGLYICKDIILRHGGAIWAENNEDKGSTFYIKLPLNKTKTIL